MILVDSRAGSKELAAPLHRLGLPVQLTDIPYGDIAFEGRGPDDTRIDIGIEFKQLGELVQSIRDGRFAGHQLPGLRQLYGESWLLIEGAWRASPKGDMLTATRYKGGWEPMRGGMSAAEYDKHLLTFQLCGGVHVHSTPTRLDTLRFLASLYRWWVDRPFDAHTSHLAVHTPRTFVPVSEFRAVVSRFPGVGLKFSKAVEMWFHGSLKRAIRAPKTEWAGITLFDSDGKSRRLGMRVAEKVVAFLEGGET